MRTDMLGTAAWGFREMDLVHQLEAVQGLGASVHELGIANAPADVPADASEALIDKVCSLYDSFGIRLLCAATGNDFTVAEEADVRLDVEKVKKVTDICGRAKIKYLRIFAGFSPFQEVTGERFTRMMAALNETSAYASGKGVTLCIETHGGVRTYTDGVEHFSSVTTDYGALSRLLLELDPRTGIVYDPANLWAVSEETADRRKIFELLESRIRYVHCKEFSVTKYGHLRPAACGDTDMDWSTILASLGNFEGPVLIEYEQAYDVVKGCRKSMDYLKPLMRRNEENYESR